MSQELDNTDKTEETANENQEFDAQSLLVRLEKLEGSNNRLLEESKTWKSKYKGLSSDVEAREKAELEKTENWKDLLEIEKNKRSEYEMQLKDTRKTVLQKELEFKVATMASDAIKVTDVINALPRDMLTIDDEGLSISGVEEAVNHVRENNAHYFKSDNKTGMSSARPNGVTGKKTYDEFSNEEKDLAFAKALEGLIT
jgi:hypothetical protein